MQDGSGDTLLALLHPGSAARPLIALVHGLGGDEDSIYMQRSASHFSRAGYRVLRLNLRGAGPSREHCRQQYHAGRSEDFAAALRALPAPLLEAGVLAIGYSLGGNMLLKFLGEGAHGLPVRAAAAVSAPIDLRRSCARIQERRNWVYHRYLLRKLRLQSLATPETGLPAQQRAAAHSARTLFDFDDRVVAPLGGFEGALDYYARCSAIGHLAGIRVPTLVIHARDDPWIPAEIYDAVEWSRHGSLEAVIPRSGGHVGFHAADDEAAWHDRRIERFFAEF
jgi:predicted alpha/beta-fold hydrolase